MTLTGANNEYIKILKGAKDTDNESSIRIKIKQDDKMPGLGSREFELVISESSYPNLFIEMMNYMEMVYLHDCFKGVDADKVIKKLRDKQDELEYWYIEYILENQIDNNLNELLNNPIDYASTNYLAPHEIAYMIFQCEQVLILSLVMMRWIQIILKIITQIDLTSTIMKKILIDT